MRMQSSIGRQMESVRRQRAAHKDEFFSSTSAPLAWNLLRPVQADCDALGEEQLKPMIVQAASREGVNPLLLRAMIRRESGSRPCAVSDKGAEGLMQLMPATQDYLGVANPFDPEENISGGTRYIKELLGKYRGNLPLALAAYNAGPQRVVPGGSVPAISETRAYVSAILSDLRNSEEE